MPSKVFFSEHQFTPSELPRRKVVFNRLTDIYLEMHAELHMPGKHDQSSHGNQKSSSQKAESIAKKQVKSAKLYADNADLYEDQNILNRKQDSLMKAQEEYDKIIADDIEKEYQKLRKMSKQELFDVYKLGNRVSALDPKSVEFDKQSVISDILHQKHGRKRIEKWIKFYPD